jgi:hypothetical protein
MEHRKQSPAIHNLPEFKAARKAFQGINSTPKKAVEKSIRRHGSKQKALEKFKHHE